MCLIHHDVHHGANSERRGVETALRPTRGVGVGLSSTRRWKECGRLQLGMVLGREVRATRVRSSGSGWSGGGSCVRYYVVDRLG